MPPQTPQTPQTTSFLGQKFKEKYPGAYDDVPDDELGRKVKEKYPGAYDNFIDTPKAPLPANQPAKPRQTPGLLGQMLAPTGRPTPTQIAGEQYKQLPFTERVKRAASTGYDIGSQGLADILARGIDIGTGIITGDPRALQEQIEGARRGLVKLASYQSPYGAAGGQAIRREQEAKLQELRARRAERLKEDPYTIGAEIERERIEREAAAQPGFVPAVTRGLVSGGLQSLPYIAGGIASGGSIPVLGTLAAAQSEFTRPEEAAMNIAGATVPIPVARAVSPLINRVAGRLPGAISQAAGRGVGQVGVGGGINVAQQLAAGETDPQKLAEAAAIGGGLTLFDPSQAARLARPRGTARQARFTQPMGEVKATQQFEQIPETAPFPQAQQRNQQRNRAIEAGKQIMDEARANADQAVNEGRIDDAINAVNQERRAIRDLLRTVKPDSPGGMKLRRNLQGQLDQAGVRFEGLRRQKKAKGVQAEKPTAEITPGEKVPPLLRPENLGKTSGLKPFQQAPVLFEAPARAPQEKGANVSLEQYVINQGGIKRGRDVRGEAAYFLGREGGRPGVISDRGVSPDELRIRANNEGYGPFETVDDFMTALRSQGKGMRPASFVPEAEATGETGSFREALNDPQVARAYNEITSDRANTGNIADFIEGAQRYKMSAKSIAAIVAGAGRGEAQPARQPTGPLTARMRGRPAIEQQPTAEVIKPPSAELQQNLEDVGGFFEEMARGEEAAPARPPSRRIQPQAEARAVPRITPENLEAVQNRRNQLERVLNDRGPEMNPDLRDELSNLRGALGEYQKTVRPGLAGEQRAAGARNIAAIRERMPSTELRPVPQKLSRADESLLNREPVRVSDEQFDQYEKQLEALRNRNLRQEDLPDIARQKLRDRIKETNEERKLRVGQKRLPPRNAPRELGIKVKKAEAAERMKLPVEERARLVEEERAAAFKRRPDLAPKQQPARQFPEPSKLTTGSLGKRIRDAESILGRAVTPQTDVANFLAEAKAEQTRRSEQKGRQITHSKLGQLEIAPDQTGVPSGKLRAVDQAGKQHTIQNPRTTGNREASFMKKAEEAVLVKGELPAKSKGKEFQAGDKVVARYEGMNLVGKVEGYDRAGKVIFSDEIGNRYKLSPDQVRKPREGQVMGMGLGALQPLIEKGIAKAKQKLSESKIKTSKGAPLAVYHGTARDFEDFDPTKKRTGDLKSSREGGIYFSPDPSVAEGYSLSQAGGLRPGANLRKSFLDIRKPFYMPAKEGLITKKKIADLEAQGYDGIVVGIREGQPLDRAQEIVAFRSDQIKNAFEPRTPREGQVMGMGLGALQPLFGKRSAKTRKQKLAVEAVKRDVNLFDSLRSPLSNVNYVGTYEKLGGRTGREISDKIRQLQIDKAYGRVGGKGAIKQLRRELRPLQEKLKAEGKPGLSDFVDAHINSLADPDKAFSGLAGFLKGFQYNTKLRFNPRAAFVNWAQPLQTLWPHLTAGEYRKISREARRPEVRERILSVISESGGKVERPALEQKRRIPDIFARASERNRIMGHLAGELFADRLGLKGDAKIRMAADWAKKVEFDNSAYDIPPLFRGKVASTLGQFRPFMIKNLERIYSDWKKAPQGTSSGDIARRSKMVVSQLALGGVSSLPGIKKIGGVVALGALANALSKTMGEDTGNKMAEAVYFGAPALVGMDLSSSVAFLEAPYGDTTSEMLLNLIGGPTFSTIAKVGEEGKKIINAKTGRTTAEEKQEASLLRLAKSITPATKTAQTIYNLAQGKTPTMRLGGQDMPMTALETAGYGLQGTPVRQSRFYEEKEQGLLRKEETGRGGRGGGRAGRRGTGRSR